MTDNEHDPNEVELARITIRKVLADTDSGVDITVRWSDDLPVLDAIGMLRMAEHAALNEENRP